MRYQHSSKGHSAPRLKKPTLDPELHSNYRPVSNLPFLSKVLERLVAGQLNMYLSQNGLFAKRQSAYRKYHSVETALVRVTNDLLLALDAKREAVLLLLDLSSAFDTVNHDILIARLKTRFGVNGIALSWFESYLRCRSQTVIVDGDGSDPNPIQRGVPQGSVLGPLLFTLYTAPIEDLILSHNLNPVFYADDTQIYVMFERRKRDSSLANIESCVTNL